MSSSPDARRACAAARAAGTTCMAGCPVGRQPSSGSRKVPAVAFTKAAIVGSALGISGVRICALPPARGGKSGLPPLIRRPISGRLAPPITTPTVSAMTRAAWSTISSGTCSSRNDLAAATSRQGSALATRRAFQASASGTHELTPRFALGIAVSHDNPTPQHSELGGPPPAQTVPGAQRVLGVQGLVADRPAGRRVDDGEVGVRARPYGTLLWIEAVQTCSALRQHPREALG